MCAFLGAAITWSNTKRRLGCEPVTVQARAMRDSLEQLRRFSTWSVLAAINEGSAGA